MVPVAQAENLQVVKIEFGLDVDGFDTLRCRVTGPVLKPARFLSKEEYAQHGPEHPVGARPALRIASKVQRKKSADRVRERKGGAFLQHRKKGHFILAIESGRHTDPGTGESFRTFALSRPEAPRTNYINEGELSAKYQAVTPERARHST